MKLGILGGTFDPIHLGHLLMAEVAWEGLGLSSVFFVPAGDPPHKQGVAKTPASHRAAMVERAIAANPHFALSPVDLKATRPALYDRYRAHDSDPVSSLGRGVLPDHWG